MQTVSRKPEGSNEQQLLFFKDLFMVFYAFIWTGQYSVDRKALGGERGEHDRQMTRTQVATSAVTMYVGTLTTRLLVPTIQYKLI